MDYEQIVSDLLDARQRMAKVVNSARAMHSGGVAGVAFTGEQKQALDRLIMDGDVGLRAVFGRAIPDDGTEG